ncbi:hypothetical protein AWB80_00313 [Caballeronia pedi]|uniref:Lipoprotein n=1 Tax=Caballeronia pedi TaxID=1777141 RepID=A0A157Z6K2_9BURK|nr:hypothetical protein [Caballeronia pedi]SAK40959.1 hypothetical protein AWB80_00313 [Caballeronia pedi]
MLSRKQSVATRAKRTYFMPVASLLMAATLSACSGSDGAAGGDIASVAKGAGAPEGASEAVSQTSDASSFFDGIFNTASGSGYYTFGWNSIQKPDTGGAILTNPSTPLIGSPPIDPGRETGITRTRFGVTGESDTTLRQSYVPLTGPDALQYSKMLYITTEGAFPADVLPYDDLGPQTKIFQRLPDGFDFGVKGMSIPLYRVTLDVRDVAGQSVKSVVKLFQGGDPVIYTPPTIEGVQFKTIKSVQPTVDYIANPLTVNMPRLVFAASDTTLMPAGSHLFVPTYTAQTQFLRVDLSKGSFDGTLQDLKRNSMRPLGEIQTLGGYQYSTPAGMGLDNGKYLTADSRYVVEYQGKVYPAELISAGERLTAPASDTSTADLHHLTAPRPAFNKIAAAFLTRQLGSTPAQTHDVMYVPDSCYRFSYPDYQPYSTCGY